MMYNVQRTMYPSSPLRGYAVTGPSTALPTPRQAICEFARHAARGGPVWRVSANWLLISRRLADESVCSFGVCFYSYGDWMGQARRLGKNGVIAKRPSIARTLESQGVKENAGRCSTVRIG